MDVLCQIGSDGIRMLDPSTSWILRIYLLDTKTSCESSVDIEPRSIRLKSNSYITNTLLRHGYCCDCSEKGRNAALAVDGSALAENKKIQPSSDAGYSVGVSTEIISKKIDDNAIPKSGDSDEQGISKHSLAETKLKTGLEAAEIYNGPVFVPAVDSDEQGISKHSLAETKLKTGLEAAEIYNGPVFVPAVGAFEAHRGLEAAEIYNGPVFVPAVGAFEAHRDSDEQGISKHSLAETKLKTGLEAAEIYNGPVFVPAVGAFEAHRDSDEQGISKHSLAETKLKTGLEADHLAKRDDNIGMKLMKKMGYAGTGGLGPRGQGISVPIPLPKWLPELRGLGFKEELEEERRKDFQELKMKKDK
ncbi:hypothetical protein BUALT_Bualt08G0095800 [Buddleja alternifolia]|uniref:G-patch domain-containing protein n=1 Tax=Buddleja alternifolia TaxID=168488 RepID=A0AAV6XG36_9LAMI|nr:hypothetical protein BUALT_Bualt08G0095800 [Buddleja alternifolia]